MEAALRRALALSALLMTLATTTATAADSYTLGIGPQQSTIELAKRWVPITDYLSKRSGVTLRFATARDIPTFQQDMRQGKYDFAYINPYHYTLFHKAAGYDAFAQEASAGLTGILVARKDGTVHTLKDLQGKDLAFPAPGAVTATVFPMDHLERLGVHVVPHYVKSHDSVYLAVAKGLYPAGGGETRTFQLLEPTVRSQLQILWRAPTLPPFLFAASPRVSPDAVKRVQAAMLAMGNDPEGRKLLQAVHFKGMRIAKDSDYDIVRRMNIHMPK